MSVLDTSHELRDRLRLIARRLKGGLELKMGHSDEDEELRLFIC